MPQKTTDKWEAHNSPLASDRWGGCRRWRALALCNFSGCPALVNDWTLLHLTSSTSRLDVKSEVTDFERKLRRNAETRVFWKWESAHACSAGAGLPRECATQKPSLQSGNRRTPSSEQSVARTPAHLKIMFKRENGVSKSAERVKRLAAKATRAWSRDPHWGRRTESRKTSLTSKCTPWLAHALTYKHAHTEEMSF